jgi:hypothetical protein
MKKSVFFCISIFGIAAMLLWLLLFSNLPHRLFSSGEADARFRIQGQKIQLRREDTWSDFEILGVNMGTGYPGLFPNEPGIPEDTYYRWFTLIADMNANTVRVYKIQTPEFYRALKRFNQNRAEPLYLIQGVDFSDDLMYSETNIHDPAVRQQIQRDTCSVIDAVHGNKLLLDAKANTLYAYTSDVSDYLIGYILGVEWDEIFVDYTCRINASLNSFDGEYLFCDGDANAFEVFMAQWGDAALAYESEVYGMQGLMSFCNWPHTDPLENEIEFGVPESELQVRDLEAFFDLEKIHMTEKVSSGLFASYNVYPYFPYFLQDGDYTHYIDSTGTANPYRKYLMCLTEHHAYPVVITEYGTPASRNICYEDIWRDIHHGGLTEKEQGAGIGKMFDDIRASGCAGSILFTWQDEWYKTAWNEGLLSDPDGRAFWANAQCAEESFGILAFEPGGEGETFYPDGDIREWENVPLLVRCGELELRMHSDEKYLYFLVTGADPAGDVNIALDVAPFCGASAVDGVRYQRPVDFLIQIHPDGTGSLQVQDYYDVLIFSAMGGYHENSVYMINRLNSELNYGSVSRDADTFRQVSRASGNIRGTAQGRWFRYPSGVLHAGNTNPAAPDYDCNGDFQVCDGGVEIRIPWQLLNFCDPSQRMILNDFRENNFCLEGLQIRSIHAAAYVQAQSGTVNFGEFRLRGWERPQFHERLKQSYYMVQEMFGKAGVQ